MSKSNGGRLIAIVLLVSFFSGLGHSCQTVSGDSAEFDDNYLVGAARCRWLDRCDQEYLVRYPGGDFRGCLEYHECAEHHRNAEYEDPEQCAAIYDRMSCGRESNWGNVSDDFFDACRIRGNTVEIEVGDPCSESGFCGFGLHCRDETDDGVDNRVCLALLENGEQCDIFLTDEDRSTGGMGMMGLSDPCLEGFCSEITGKCEAKREPGDVCEKPEQCRTGMCRDSTCLDFPGVGDDCLDRLFCDRMGLSVCLDGKCVRPLDEGESCLGKGQREPIMSVCRLGLVCFEGVCTRGVCENGMINDVCDDSWNCNDGLYCHGKKHTCQRYGEKGAPCENGFAQCAPGFFCDYQSDSCQELKADGADCFGGSECESGNCQDEVCGPVEA